MPDTEPIKNNTTILIYKDGKPVLVSLQEFMRMLEELHG